MAFCSAYGCSFRSNRKSKRQVECEQNSGEKIRLYRFPENPDLRKRWVEEMYRADFEPNQNSRLCSQHFTKSCFYRYATQTRLVPGSVPTIFPAFPDHLKKIIKAKRQQTHKLEMPPQHTPPLKELATVEIPPFPMQESVITLLPEERNSPTKDKLKQILKPLEEGSRKIIKVRRQFTNKLEMPPPLTPQLQEFIAIEIPPSQVQESVVTQSLEKSNSPSKDELKQIIKSLKAENRKKVRHLQQKIRRRDKQVAILSAVVDELTKKTKYENAQVCWRKK